MILLFVQAVLLVANFVVGFLVSIPIGINKSKYNGNCLLYSYVSQGKEVSKLSMDLVDSGSNLTCNFCIFTGSVSLLLAAVLFIGTLFLLIKSNYLKFMVLPMGKTGRSEIKKNIRKPLIGAWVHFCTSSGMALILFVTACLISAGFNNFCEHALKKINKEVKSCAQLEDYMKSFYTDLSIAQVSSWTGAALWLVLAIMGRFQLRKLNPKNIAYSSNRTASGDYSQIESVSTL